MSKNLFKSFGYAVLMVLFPVTASVTIQVGEFTSDIAGYAILTMFYGIASVIGFMLLKRVRKNTLVIEGREVLNKSILWFAPLIVIEFIAFFAGVKLHEGIKYYIVLVLFTIFVGISEEVFFRGIIVTLLRNKSAKYAIVVSSLLFAVLHLTNLANGISVGYVILQVVFSLLFGIVAAQITVLKKSLIPAIIWHFSHDLIAFITGNEWNDKVIIISIVQCVVLAVYAVYLNRVVED